MATEALKNRKKLILDKIRKRPIEIGRNIYQHVHAIDDLAMVETDLMECEERELAMRNGRIALDLKPYQIRTPGQ